MSELRCTEYDELLFTKYPYPGPMRESLSHQLRSEFKVTLNSCAHAHSTCHEYHYKHIIFLFSPILFCRIEAIL